MRAPVNVDIDNNDDVVDTSDVSVVDTTGDKVVDAVSNNVNDFVDMDDDDSFSLFLSLSFAVIVPSLSSLSSLSSFNVEDSAVGVLWSEITSFVNVEGIVVGEVSSIIIVFSSSFILSSLLPRRNL